MRGIASLGDFDQTLSLACATAPYLDRLCRRRLQTRELFALQGPAHVIQNALKQAKDAALEDEETAKVTLRNAKADVHLACAIGDLMGTLSLNDVTKALSDLADFATQSALAVAARNAPARDQTAFIEEAVVPGLFILAMGKHGAHELNYSSDIDLAAFYDRDSFGEDDQDRAGSVCVRIIQSLSRILEDVTPEGYVFRVDWRLRPDPASTPVAVSLRAAEAYYESVGQNWERAAFIKARQIAGDPKAANSLLTHLRPFIWRKNLDFAAIDDVQSILRQIHSVRRSTDLDDPAFDVKLGRGGIREIEFFVQTQQLILGGREPLLRGRRTLDSLNDLVIAGRIDGHVRDDLAQGYAFLRAVEHRIQMLDDEQTHKLSPDGARRMRVATLSGYSDLADFDGDIRACREMVRARVRELFPDGAALSADSGSLVFTGVEDDPETLETLRGLGFGEPSRVAKAIRGWHHGQIGATRTARARELLTALTPELLNAIAATGDPDAGFARFQDFFASLPAGVQILSLFRAEPQILRETCLTLALAPRLSETLAKRPATLDAMLSPRFLAPLEQDGAGGRLASMTAALAGIDSFEGALDVVRRVHCEEMFRIGFQVLHGHTSATHAALAYSELAEATITALLPVARQALMDAHGTCPSRVAVCAWGKLGGCELAADSDLDLMIVYDPNADGAESTGPRALSGEQYHARLTQRLISALTAQTAEGTLYDVDMQLRPSGTKGPVAVRLQSLTNYYQGQAWTWEYQALTRLRPVAGDPELCTQIEALAKTALSQSRDSAKTVADIVAMREKMVQAHPVRGSWDIKRQRGGLIDLEFLVQAHQLQGAAQGLDVAHPNTLMALSKLAEAGVLEREIAGRLSKAGAILHDIRQILAVASGPDFEPETAAIGLKAAIARALHAPDFRTATAIYEDARKTIATAWVGFTLSATE
jgi:[glutamine synthetase] adenylyltransferase / [glutamine synthetase]-adenylyl-L-tyrosine phosphorylase